MAWTGLALTVEGQNALNQAQVANSMNIKSIVIGDGKAPANFRTQKALVHQLYEITGLKVDVEEGKCVLTADIPQMDYDYYFREIGVMVVTDEGEILYVYDNCSDSAQYIVSTTGVETTRKRIRLSLNISDVAEITVENSGILYVAYDDYEETVHRMDAEIKSNEKKAADHLADKENPHETGKDQVGLDKVDNTADADKPVSGPQQAAIDALKKLLSDIINNHLADTNNPHKVSREQMKVDKVDNTPDMEKPVSEPQQTALNALYQQLTGYVEQKIAGLINGAPAALDTLKEVADAIASHKSIMDALDAAIGKKANEAEFDSHVKDTTAHVTAAERTKWNDANTKKHTHDNKTVLDGITSTLINGWNSAVDHISDAVKHITSAERDKWNNGSPNYGTCATAAATAAKTVACANFKLTTGAEITIKWTYTNTAASPTLNVNSTGAKPIYYRGAAISAGYLAANRTYTFRYNGAQWDFVGDINTDTNTTYGNMKGATADAAGAAGLAPAPGAGAQGKYLRGDGTWQTPATTNNAVTQTNTPSTNASYRILMSATADDTTRTEGARKDADLTYNPSTNTLTTGKVNADTADSTVTFTTGDATNPTGWADITAIASGEKVSSLMRKFSLAVKNVRYLWKLLGSTSLSGIGDGTVTGAIASLNTGINSNISAVRQDLNKAIRVLVENVNYSKIVSDGKIVISLVRWLPFGIYFFQVNVEQQYLWSYIANVVWDWQTIHVAAANCNASDVAFSGDRGSGLTITITNANIKEDSNVIVSIKSISS